MQSQLFSSMFKRPQNKVLFLFHSLSDSVLIQFVEYDCDFLQEKRERIYKSSMADHQHPQHDRYKVATTITSSIDGVFGGGSVVTIIFHGHRAFITYLHIQLK